MAFFQKKVQGIKDAFNTDWNLVRLRRGVVGLPSRIEHGAGRYFSNKVPVVQWIPAYDPRWLFGDVVAGVTVGIILTLQAVNLSSPFPGAASVHQTLIGSWLPGFIYAVTGTSRSRELAWSPQNITYVTSLTNIPLGTDISIGPTATVTTLSFQIVGGISHAVPQLAQVPPGIILAALTFCTGIWSLIFGLLNLGILFDLVPISLALAIVMPLSLNTIIFQVPVFLGLIGVPQLAPAIPPAVISAIGSGGVSVATLAIAAASIVILGVLQFVHNKFGKGWTPKSKAIGSSTIVRSLFIIILLTAISFFVLKSVPLDQQVSPAIPPMTAAPAAAAQAPVAAAALQAAATNATALPPGGIIPARRDLSINVPSGLAGISPALLKRRPIFSPGASFPSGQLVPRQPAAAAAAAAPPAAKKLPFWAAFPEFSTPISGFSTPVFNLILALLFPSLILFATANIEHVVVAKVFGHQQEYTIDASQEMVSLGLTNIANSFFGGVPVSGGDVGRSSLLSVSGGKSPLSQLFVSLTVLVAMNPAANILRFLPQAAFSAVIVVAIFDQMPPQALMGIYMKISFADFFAFFLVFNIAIIGLPGLGNIGALGLGIFSLVIYTLFRFQSARPKLVLSVDLEDQYKVDLPYGWRRGDVIPAGTHVVKLETDMIWTNAERTRRHIFDQALTYQVAPPTSSPDKEERAWNFRLDKHIEHLRRRKGGSMRNSESVITFRPQLRIIIIDMSACSFIDAAAIQQLQLVKKMLRKWAGDNVEFRFVGLNADLKRRFGRVQWTLFDPYAPPVAEEDDYQVKDLVFEHLPHAVKYMSQDKFDDVDVVLEKFNFGVEVV